MADKKLPVKKMSLQESQSIHNEYIKKMELVVSKLNLKLIDETDELKVMALEEEINSKKNFIEKFKNRIAQKNDCKK